MQNNLWQSKHWEKFQNALGRKTWFFHTHKKDLLAIQFSLIHKYNWLDIPRGPIDSSQESQQNLKHLIQKAEQSNTVFIRIMPPFLNYKQLNINYPIKTAHANHHPDNTLKINLKQNEEEILAQMKPKGRYNIRLAKKKGVIIKESKDVSVFFKLIQTTTQRNQFWGHSQSYYEIMLKTFQKRAQLLLAEYKGETIAGGIFIYTQNEAIYYYGASGNKYRNIMAPYLIQWTAILEAKKRGCLWYDFLGIAPEKADKKHPWLGVTDFKKKFGGEIINYPPAQEIILKPFLYRFFLLAKKIKKIIY